MVNPFIRYAEKQDIPEILTLMDQLGYPTSQDVLIKRFDRFVQVPGHGIAVALINKEIVGWIAWSTSEFFVFDKTRFHIEGLVVKSGYRQRGIGKSLMSFVEDIARAHKPSLVAVTTRIDRAKEGTHDFYKKLGYKNEGHMAMLYLTKEM